MLACMLAPLIFAGCMPSSSPVSVDPGHAADRRYAPVYATKQKPTEQDKRGTAKGDFLWAAESTTLAVAASRWEEFLRTHNPHDGELEDAFQANQVAAAKYELMRVYYLLGRTDQGDRLLRELDPLDLLP